MGVGTCCGKLCPGTCFRDCALVVHGLGCSGMFRNVCCIETNTATGETFVPERTTCLDIILERLSCLWRTCAVGSFSSMEFSVGSNWFLAPFPVFKRFRLHPFHRAFDMCRNPKEALEQIIELGCHRILTSGLEANAPTGISMLKELIEWADGRIIIMPGCGVNPGNILQIAEETGATEFHFSGRTQYESGMIYRNPKVSMGGTVQIDEYKKDVTNVEIVKEAVSILAKKDEKDEALEKKNKESRAKRKKKNDFDDDDDDLD